MLTRIEIDGFKTFHKFELNVPPFLVVLGRNASGKSNLFDAVQLLSRIAGRSLVDAIAETRGEPEELLRQRQDGSQVDRMAFAVEVLLDPIVRDPFGDEVAVSHTRLRYEVVIEARGVRGRRRFYVVHEAAKPIRAGEDQWVAASRASEKFRGRHLSYRYTAPALIDTRPNEQGQLTFYVSQAGHQGRPRELPARQAEATVLSSITTAQFPLQYALRRELESWRFLQLDPMALRAPSSFHEAGLLRPDGSNLASVLNRIQTQTAAEDRPNGELADISADLANLVPGILGVEVHEDEARRQWEVFVRTRDEAPYSARVASDGTLRLLALLAVMYDPDHRGLVCFEEPENGIFPQRLAEFVGYLRGMVTHPSAVETSDGPLTQLILSSHAPKVLDAISSRDDVVYTDLVALVEPGQAPSVVTKVRRFTRDEQLSVLEDLAPVSDVEIDAYRVHQELG